MTKRAKLTSKGQITVPRDIRRLLGVHPGDSILFEKDADGVRVRAVRLKSNFRKYRGIGNPGLPTGRKALLRYLRKMRGS